MKDKRRGIFSLSIKDSKYFNDKQEKIEFVSCPRGGKDCTEHRSEINSRYLASNKYLLKKDYIRSIEELQGAFYKTNELQQSSCVNCARHFRSTIIQSLEYIHEDLQKMTNSWYRPKRYQSSFDLANKVLDDLKKVDHTPGR